MLAADRAAPAYRRFRCTSSGRPRAPAAIYSTAISYSRATTLVCCSRRGSNRRIMPDPPTHLELYEQVKALVLEEPVSRGQRIDLQRLADRYRVSITPIREVLFELMGQRLVSSHLAGGFQVVVPDAAALQDLYAWFGQQLLATIHLLPDPVMRRIVSPFATTIATLQQSDPGDLIARLALAIGQASGNAEVVDQIARGNERLFRARRGEAALFPDRTREFASIVKVNGFDVRNNVRRRLLAYHRRRVEQSAQIAALLE